MGLPRFDKYAANPDDLRRIAVRVRRDAHGISGLVGDLKPLRARAVESATGEISPYMKDAILDPRAYGREVARTSLWAALQLENFADAIEVYNVESKNPWSIRRLNAKAELADAAATAGESGIPGVTADSESDHPGVVDSPDSSGPGLDAKTLNGLAYIYRKLGRLEDAAGACEQAIDAAKRHCDQAYEGALWDTLGQVRTEQGRHREAVEHFRNAVELVGGVREEWYEGAALSNLGRAYRVLGQPGQARENWERALAIFDAVGAVDQDEFSRTEIVELLATVTTPAR